MAARETETLATGPLGRHSVFELVCRHVYLVGGVTAEDRALLKNLQKFLRLPREEAEETWTAVREAQEAGELEEVEGTPRETFRKACELGCADGPLTDRERKILRGLGKLLGLEKDVAREVLREAYQNSVGGMLESFQEASDAEEEAGATAPEDSSPPAARGDPLPWRLGLVGLGALLGVGLTLLLRPPRVVERVVAPPPAAPSPSAAPSLPAPAPPAPPAPTTPPPLEAPEVVARSDLEACFEVQSRIHDALFLYSMHREPLWVLDAEAWEILTELELLPADLVDPGFGEGSRGHFVALPDRGGEVGCMVHGVPEGTGSPRRDLAEGGVTEPAILERSLEELPEVR